ncbi:MAG TPA: hypothetical protein VI895_05500 [Bdellovibrionota bacterium]|nr:hypothetical protein [Bdellovibrionota bacterium]
MYAKVIGKFGLLLALVATLNGCLIFTYRVKPPEAWDAKPTPPTRPEKMFYSVGSFGGLTFGGYDELRAMMAKNSIFPQTEAVTATPSKGLYVRVDVEQHDPSIGSLVWGYIALSFLLIPPAYSGSSGFIVRYQVYRDAQPVKLYEYEIRRKGLGWIVLLPFAWVNFLTYDEEDAFRVVTNQFFQDGIRDGFLAAKNL